MRGPEIQRPVYLSGAPIPKDTGDACVKLVQDSAPVWGVIGGAIVGALAFWAVPKIMDRVLPQLDPAHGEPVSLEIDGD